ncbi:Uncharacterised protein [Vibrio cholerae]|nr:Uncharacterised protein [Vibrio cholerae]CSA73967.1 Uncharacterised protein [Vibrio cholerae]CSB47627.1 Uncharacterised protein [Vibrio cholerae]CSB49660.1 Uncharacterised protein [Vibrio cholerae]CSC01867.1 Uncharacterised protein [Vibrio cholerae]
MAQIILGIAGHFHRVTVECIVVVKTAENLIQTETNNVIEQNNGFAPFAFLLRQHHKAWQLVGWNLDQRVFKFIATAHFDRNVSVFVF